MLHDGERWVCEKRSCVRGQAAKAAARLMPGGGSHSAGEPRVPCRGDKAQSLQWSMDVSAFSRRC